MISETKTKNLIPFLDASVTPYQAISSIKDYFSRSGFIFLNEDESWALTPGKSYLITINDSAAIAFRAGSDPRFAITASHVDSPGFRLKPNPRLIKEKAYLACNTEVYGSPILSSWLDRPLSLAGRVITRAQSNGLLKSVPVKIDRPIMIIPSLAPHMSSNGTKSTELNKQNDMLPLFALLDQNGDTDEDFMSFIARETGIDEPILDADLFLYDTTGAELLGQNNEFIVSGRLDNLASVYASMQALVTAKPTSITQVAVFFNNEEVGSSTRQGADSPMLSSLLERIIHALGGSREDYLRSFHTSFMVSVDGAHGVHPHHPDRSDPTNRPIPGKGIAIKISASMSYTTDGMTGARFREICRVSNIPFQTFVNRSDQRGGSTIGPVSSSHLPIPSIDMGIPMLAMHSCRETAALSDIVLLTESLTTFYEHYA